MHSFFHLRKRLFFAVLVLALALGFAAAPVGTTSLAQEAPLDIPDVIVDEYVNEYAITDGLLYWAYACYGGEFRAPGYLRRKPTHGGPTLTLQTTTALDCYTFWWLNADDSGVYYVNYETSSLDFRSTDDPTTATPLYTFSSATSDPIAQLELDDSYIYWAAENNNIYRLSKSGGSALAIAGPRAGLSDLEQWGTELYWLENSGLWHCTKPSCTTPTQVSAHSGTSLKSYILYMFWVEPTASQTIRQRFCFLSCSETVFYTAPDANWVINRPEVGECPDGSQCLYWEEYSVAGSIGRVRRKPLAGGTVDTIADNLLLGPNPVETDDQGVYFFLGNQYLGRLPFTASVVQRDMSAEAWEITQGLQSLNNDVPLVANKTTYVRLYPQLSGTNANFVQAWLEGERGGTPLLGSPLEPLNGTFELDDTWTYDREDRNGGFLFRLPDSWTDAGSITLRGVVDPRNVYADTHPADNTLTRVVTFATKPPVCDIFIPVRTHTPAASTEAPNFWRMIDLHRRLWPVPDVWVYHQNDDVAEPQVCWWGPFPYPCSGPFELDEGTSWSDWVKDDDEALFHIGTRAVFSDDPDECDDIGSAVHYIGMIHPDAPWGWGGLAYSSDWLPNASLVFLPPRDADPPDVWTWPWEGSSLAHETSHNHERKHVDCGSPADPDGSFPYPPCALDDSIDPTHFGFDINELQPIPPEIASDYMSYSGWSESATWQGRWVSDYTYGAMFGRFLAAESPEASTLSSLAPDASNVLIGANVDPLAGQGVLFPAWVFPTTALSQGLQEKWQAMQASAFDAQMLSVESAEAVSYHVRLVDAGNATLADYTLTPIDTEEHQTEAHNLVFLQTFSAPTGEVARLDLMADTSVLYSLQPGSQPPTLNILQPAGGEVYTDSMTISWQADDADPDDSLLFNVQYSPDNGLTWISIVTNFPAAIEGDMNYLSLDDLGGLGASQGANGLIRVAATDGYHTVLADSAPFTVENQPPQAYILSPLSTEIYPASEVVPLRGGAADPESGAISGSSLAWSIDGAAAGSGAENSVAGLAPGTYAVSLNASDPQGGSDSASSYLTISRLEIPLSGSTPTLDGVCDDPQYQGVSLVLAPFSAGGQASVRLMRTSTALWACFGGMPSSTSSVMGIVGLRMDVNNSRDAQAQTDDYAFFVSEDGTPFTRSGNGSGGFFGDGPGGLLAQVSTSGAYWFAELKIDSSVLNGWNHPIGLEAEYLYFIIRNAWPYAANAVAPNTWAWTILGTMPEIDQVTPEEAIAGSPTLNLTLDGEGFQDGAVVNWLGSALPTTYISSTQLSAVVDAGLIAAGSYTLLTVTNPDTITSNPVVFTIRNPQPAISSLDPPGVAAETASLNLTVRGSGFVNGSKVIWNGTVLTSTYINATTLQVTVDADLLKYGGQAGVAVRNPDPAGGESPEVAFYIYISGRVLLPMIVR